MLLFFLNANNGRQQNVYVQEILTAEMIVGFIHCSGIYFKKTSQ